MTTLYATHKIIAEYFKEEDVEFYIAVIDTWSTLSRYGAFGGAQEYPNWHPALSYRVKARPWVWSVGENNLAVLSGEMFSKHQPSSIPEGFLKEEITREELIRYYQKGGTILYSKKFSPRDWIGEVPRPLPEHWEWGKVHVGVSPCNSLGLPEATPAPAPVPAPALKPTQLTLDF